MSIATTNPTTGEKLKTFAAFDAAEVEARVSRARSAFESWRRAPIETRIAVVRRAGELLDERKEEYGRLMTLEMGKLFTAARDEAAKCALACRYYADEAPRILAHQPVTSRGERGYVAFDPLGVVLAVMPWNFPFWQVLRF